MRRSYVLYKTARNSDSTRITGRIMQCEPTRFAVPFIPPVLSEKTDVPTYQGTRSRPENHGQSRLFVERARSTDHPLYRRRWYRCGYQPGDDQGTRRSGRESLRWQAENPLDGNLRGREIDQGLRSRRLAAGGNARSSQGIRGTDQGPVDDPGWRRNPFAER